MTAKGQIAIVGTGVMGSNLARNLARNGARVVLNDRSVESARRVADAHPEAGFIVSESLADMVTKLARPRRIILLVPAGGPVDAVIDALDGLLEDGDTIVDAGNSLFVDTDRRNARADGRPWSFVGMGVSGGAKGALEGPSMMPGGDLRAWQTLKPLLESIAAVTETGPCVTYCGRGSAGHFVKMVHNGIEYGDMQLIAETATLMRRGLGWSGAQVADAFSAWDAGELDSFLIEITAKIFRTPDPKDADSLLVDAILDKAGQKGTGRWTVRDAVGLGVAVPTIAAAVDARVLSSHKALRIRAEAGLGAPVGPLEGVGQDDLRDALYASKIASYTQGFRLLQAASEARNYGVNCAEIARIWTGGCIIRARFLARVTAAFRSQPDLDLLALSDAFAEDLKSRVPGWRRVVGGAVAAGLPIPGLAASLTWYDTLTTGRGSANIIQAQRDYFGSHTYIRVDQPGVKIHTDWGGG